MKPDHWRKEDHQVVVMTTEEAEVLGAEEIPTEEADLAVAEAETEAVTEGAVKK